MKSPIHRVMLSTHAEMTMEKPAATSQTQQNKSTATKVAVTPKRKVTYVFDTKATTSSLKIPYAVAINGKALSAYSKKPARVSGGHGKIVVTVDAGSRVSLFLNSDAHPDYRKNPVYEVTATERDVLVQITEKLGQHSDSDKPILKAKAGESDSKLDEYTAPLTGDIWMKVSHCYTAAEADTLIPAAVSKEIRAAVKSIYGPLTTNKLIVKTKTTQLTITFDDGDNPHKNITKYSLLSDGLTRVHPAGFAALLSAAVDNNIPSITVTSCWRPSLGSIAHRAGLGLDVNHLCNVQLNRQELSNQNARYYGNVSKDERQSYQGYEKSKHELSKLEHEHASTSEIRDATKAQVSTEKLWEKDIERDDPAEVKKFRDSLLNTTGVRQLFDPWYMDTNTHDHTATTPNEQISANEKLHAHHLHITVDEPKIL